MTQEPKEPIYGAELCRYVEAWSDDARPAFGAERTRRDVEALARLEGGGVDGAAAALRGDRGGQDRGAVRLPETEDGRERDNLRAIEWRRRAKEHRARILDAVIVPVLVGAAIALVAFSIFLVLTW